MVKSKMSLVAVILIMAMSFNIYAQTSDSAKTDETVQTEVPSYSLEEDTSYFSGTQSNLTGESQTGRNSTVGFLIKTIVVLILVCVAIYFILKLVKNKNGITNDDDFLRRVASVSLGQGKTVEIVTLLDHGYIIGVTNNNINLLGEINDKELLEAMNLNYDKKLKTNKPKTFNEVLDLLLPGNLSRKNDSIYNEAEENLEKDISNKESDEQSENQNVNQPEEK